jgi:restriction system protein
MMLPILESYGRGGPLSTADLSQMIANHFDLTDEDRSLAIGSGRLTYKNRVAWAVAHLSGAGLLDRLTDGVHRITAAGSEAK